jgi:hypothetical protein
MDVVDGNILRAAAAAGLALLVAQGIPRALNSIYKWTTAALFSSLTTRVRRLAMLFGAASALWLLVAAGFVYTPLTALAPRILPFPDGLVRMVLVIELWLLILLPLIMGAVEAYYSQGSLAHRLSMIPRAFVHVVGIGMAFLMLAPWIVWRFAAVRLTRRRKERLDVDIDPGRYESVTAALVSTLRRAGLHVSESDLPATVRVSRWFLHHLGPPLLRPEAEYEARRLLGDGYSLLVFDGLIDIVAKRDMTSRVRLGLIGGLPPDGMWLTQSEEARELERLIRTGGPELDDIPRRIAEVDATLEEWRILSWEYMQVVANRAPHDDGRPDPARDDGGRAMPGRASAPPTRPAG